MVFAAAYNFRQSEEGLGVGVAWQGQSDSLGESSNHLENFAQIFFSSPVANAR